MEKDDISGASLPKDLIVKNTHATATADIC